MRRPSIKPCKPSTRPESASGFPRSLPKGHDLSEVPADLDQNFSAVRQALVPVDPERGPARLLHRPSWNATPKQALEDFCKQDPTGNIDRIIERLDSQRTGRQAGRGQAPRRPAPTWIRPS